MALLRKIMCHNAPLLITCVATILIGYLPYLIPPIIRFVDADESPDCSR